MLDVDVSSFWSQPPQSGSGGGLAYFSLSGRILSSTTKKVNGLGQDDPFPRVRHTF